VRDTYDLSCEMQQFYTELAETEIPASGVFADLFNSALREVSWYDYCRALHQRTGIGGLTHRNIGGYKTPPFLILTED